MKNDEILMKEYREGSEQSFLVLYRKYSSMVYGYLKKKIHSNEVDDLYQKVWRQLHEKRHLYQDQPFLPWFFVLIRHLLIDEYRSLGRKKSKELRDEFIRASETDNSAEELEELLRELPSETRDLVRKYYLEGISYEELESDTGLSQTGLRQRLSRAIRSMRKIYEEQ